MWITLPLLGEFPALVDAQRHGVASFNGIVTGSPAGFDFYRIFFMKVGDEERGQQHDESLHIAVIPATRQANEARPPPSGSVRSSPQPFFLHPDPGMWGRVIP